MLAPHVHLWTRDVYHSMIKHGLFDRQHVDLIEGHIIDMSPMESEHATAVALTATALEHAFAPGYFVRWQMPFGVGEISEPEPDITVVTGGTRDYTAEHPTSAVLPVEVADSSLSYDRTEKASLYAKAGVLDYWMLNLIDQQLEVYRHPVLDSEAPYGFGYAARAVLMAAERVTPLALPTSAIVVADLLP